MSRKSAVSPSLQTGEEHASSTCLQTGDGHVSPALTCGMENSSSLEDNTFVHDKQNMLCFKHDVYRKFGIMI